MKWYCLHVDVVKRHSQEEKRERERERERYEYLNISDRVGSQLYNSKVSFSNDSFKLIKPNVGILLATITD